MPAMTLAGAGWHTQLAGRPIAVRWRHDAELMVATGEGRVYALPLAGEPGFELEVDDEGLLALDVAPDGAHWASGGCDGRARIWRGQHVVAELAFDAAADRGWVEHVAFAPDARRVAAARGRTVVLGGVDGSPHARDEGLAPRRLEHPSTIAAIAWSPSGDALACAGYGGVWVHAAPTRPGTIAAEPRLLPWKGSMLSVAWDPRGRHLACGCQDGSVHFWRWPRGDDGMMSGYPTKPLALAWSPDGRSLATGGGPAVTIWAGFRGRGPENTEPLELPGHRAVVDTLAFSTTRPRLASGSRSGQVIVYGFDGRGSIDVDAELGSPVEAVVFSPDDRHLAAITHDGGVRVWPMPE